jgi:AcrR family transcriptional regulator
MTSRKKKAPPLSGREKLIQAGIKVFGTYGYEGASTRELAREAGINISQIPYYFGGKEGLYAAVLAHIAGTAQGAMGERIARIKLAMAEGAIRSGGPRSLSEEECRRHLHGFIEGLTRFLLSEKASPHMGRIFIREQMDPTPAFDPLYDSTIRPMHEMVTTLVTTVTGLQGEQAVLAAQALIGQAIIFKTHREVALRRTGWTGYGEGETEAIVQLVKRHTDAILDMYVAKRKPS